MEKNKELQSQTQQKLLLEGEMRQLTISLKNCENLLGRNITTPSNTTDAF